MNIVKKFVTNLSFSKTSGFDSNIVVYLRNFVIYFLPYAMWHFVWLFDIASDEHIKAAIVVRNASGLDMFVGFPAAALVISKEFDHAYYANFLYKFNSPKICFSTI